MATRETKKKEKGLTDKLSDDPLTVRVNIEPAARSVGEVGRYNQLTKVPESLIKILYWTNLLFVLQYPIYHRKMELNY